MDAALLAALERAKASSQATRARLARKHDAAKERHRAEMPNVAEVVDGFRAAGFTLRVIGAHDLVTGKKVGQL